MASNISNYDLIFEQLQGIIKHASNLYNNSYIKHSFLKHIDFENSNTDLTNTSQPHLNQITNLVNSTITNHLKNTELHQKNHSSAIDVEDNSLPTFDLLIDGYAILIVALIGIILNALGIRLLSTKSKRKKMFNMLLSTLLVFDTFFLTFKILTSLQKHFISVSANYLRMCYVFTNSGVRFSLISSILMVVALGHSRYHAVNKPFRQRILLLSWKKRRIEFLRYVIPTLILAIILTLPIIWEINNGSTDIEDMSVQVMPSKLRLNPYYSIFCNGMLFLGLLWLFPVACLIYFTYKILKTTNKNNITRTNQPRNEERRRNQEDKVSKTLVAIIVIFLTLHSLRIVTYIGELFILLKPYKDDSILQLGYGVPKWLHVVAPISDLCIVLNASVNILIYKYLNSTTLFNNCPVCIPTCLKNSVALDANDSRRNSQYSINIQNMESLCNDENNDVNVEVVYERCTFQVRNDSRRNSQYSINMQNMESLCNDENNTVNVEVEYERCTFQVRKEGTEYL